MNIPHDKFCVLPWISLEASPVGTVRPCCLARDELTDHNGNKFNLATATFDRIQNSDSLKRLRQQFLNAKQPQTCRRCWTEERAGRTSKRMHTLERLKDIMVNDDGVWDLDAKPLLYLDLKLGNICNLKCRICGSWSSSTYAAEELANLEPGEDKKTNFHYQMLKNGAWPRENQQFWSEIDQVIDQIRYIEFTGGEPFMITEHFDMLKRLVERGIAGQIEIHYNTNGTQWPAGAEEIWCHFRRVEIAISVDDVGARFEYQRQNASWDQVNQNLQKFRELRSRCANIVLQVCTTVNIFNVYYLEAVANWIDQQAFDYIYWNMMHDAWYYSIATLPDRAKAGIAQQLKAAQVSERSREEFDRIIDFMMGGVGLDAFQLRREIANTDRRRQQNFREIAPEMAELIAYDGPN